MRTRFIARLSMLVALTSAGVLGWVLPAFAQDADEAIGAGLSFAFIGCYCLILLVALALFAFWVWMLIDCIMRQDAEFPAGQTKTTWLLILILTWIVALNWIAALFYYFMIFKKIPRSK